MHDRSLEYRTNVFMSVDAPNYAEAVEWARTADPADWKYDPDRDGIWVAYGWWEKRRIIGTGSRFEKLPVATG